MLNGNVDFKYFSGDIVGNRSFRDIIGGDRATMNNHNPVGETNRKVKVVQDCDHRGADFLVSAALMVADRIMIRLDNRKMLPKNRTQHSASYCVIERYDRDDLSIVDRPKLSVAFFDPRPVSRIPGVLQSQAKPVKL